MHWHTDDVNRLSQFVSTRPKLELHNLTHRFSFHTAFALRLLLTYWPYMQLWTRLYTFTSRRCPSDCSYAPFRCNDGPLYIIAVNSNHLNLKLPLLTQNLYGQRRCPKCTYIPGIQLPAYVYFTIKAPNRLLDLLFIAPPVMSMDVGLNSDV